MDDLSTYGSGNRYHDGSPAVAVLNGNGSCPDPLEAACSTKEPTAAFLEDPIDCGDQGWYCRILEEPGWDPVNLVGDFNFGYYNTTEGFAEKEYDQSGHCHGSDRDETYYWWVRDHWFRQYNGRVRCCCGWDDLSEGRVANRCDFRKLLTPDEDVNECRDTNEEGVTPYEGGCERSNNPTQLNVPIPEDDAKCWEIQKFGEPCVNGLTVYGEACGEETENENNNENENENEDEDEDENEDEDEDEENEEDNDNEDENNEDEEDDEEENPSEEDDNEDEEDDEEENPSEEDDNEDEEEDPSEEDDNEDEEDDEDEE